MTNEEMISSLKMIEMEMITLEPRLSEPYSSNVKTCAEAAKDIAHELTVQSLLP
jgi:hypothetical protein